MVLYHHGIKGMHWGIRRFQNKDGSLTAEGIKRYRTDLNFKYKYDKYKAKQDAKAAEKAKQKEIKRVDKLMNKDTRKLTAAELEERIGRLAMEQQVSEIEASIIKAKDQPKNKDKGNNNNNQSKENVATGIVKKLAAATATAIITKASNEIGERVVKSIFKNKDDKQNQQQNQQQSQQQKPKWTDKDVSGDYSKGIIGSVNKGKSAVNNILEKTMGKSVSDLWAESTTEIRNADGKLVANDDHYFWSKGVDLRGEWKNTDNTVSVSPKKSYTLYSDSPSVDAGKKATKNWISGAWDQSSSGISGLGNFGDYSRSTTNLSIEKPITSLGNFGEWSSSFTKSASSSLSSNTPISKTSDSYSTTVGKSALNDIWGVAKSTPVSASTSGIKIGTDSINYFTSNKPYSITATKEHTMTGRLDGRAPTSTHRLNKMIDQKTYKYRD